MKVAELKSILQNVLTSFFKKDNLLVDSKSHEQAISHRLAYYLEREREDFLEENAYSVDVEYNRYFIDSKRLNGRLIKPDIIVHRRGKNSEKDNLIVFEIKKGELNEHDKRKLIEMTSFKGKFKYRYGVGIYNLDKINKTCNIDIYHNGELYKEWIFNKGRIVGRFD